MSEWLQADTSWLDSYSVRGSTHTTLILDVLPTTGVIESNIWGWRGSCTPSDYDGPIWGVGQSHVIHALPSKSMGPWDWRLLWLYHKDLRWFWYIIIQPSSKQATNWTGHQTETSCPHSSPGSHQYHITFILTLPFIVADQSNLVTIHTTIQPTPSQLETRTASHQRQWRHRRNLHGNIQHRNLFRCMRRVERKSDCR